VQAIALRQIAHHKEIDEGIFGLSAVPQDAGKRAQSVALTRLRWQC
jgi:hypothetical protein